MAYPDRTLSGGRVLIYRTPLAIRLTHWVNAVALVVLLMSGLQILNAHPALYWGETSHFETPLAAIVSEPAPDGQPRGTLRIGGWAFDTTGWLGVSTSASGRPVKVAFPSWATLPGYHDLGQGRSWHFFFSWALVINGAIYALWNVFSGRLGRDLIPAGAQLRGIGRSILDHILLRHPRGDEARRYNVLQKLTYLGVMFGLLPLMVATGLSMSPSVNAAAPWLSEMLGGRQSARTLHFVAAFGLVMFFIVHIAMVLLAGPLNELRSIITGWFVIRTPADAEVKP